MNIFGSQGIVAETARFAKEGIKERDGNKLSVVTLRILAVASGALAALSLAFGPIGLPFAAAFGVTAHHCYRVGENMADIHHMRAPTSADSLKKQALAAGNQVLNLMGLRSNEEAAVHTAKEYLDGTIPGFILGLFL